VSGPRVSTGIQKPAFDAVTSTFSELIQASGPVTANVAGTYIFSPTSGAAGVAAATTGAFAFPLDPADFVAPAGKTLKARVKASMIVNAVAPTNTFTFGLYPVATTGGASGSAPTIATVGTVVTGSTAAIVAPSAAAGATPVVSTTFTFPAAGYYVLGAVVTAGGAANSVVTVTARLQRVYA
jgi:hypothetical protein